MKRLFFVLFASVLFTACSSTPKKAASSGPAKRYQWETKAVIRDLNNNKSNSVDIDVMSEYPNKVRMEISAVMGVSIASLLITPSEVRYALYQQKRYFEGKPSENSFLPLMNIPLHPSNFLSIVYDLPIRGQGWVCTPAADKTVGECNQATRSLKVQWSDRTPEGQKKVVISAPGFEMRWLFRPPQTEVQFKDETFHLEAPPEFKTIQLR